MSEYGSPQDTLDKISPYLGAFGITRIANVTGLDRLNVPVFMICRPNSRSLAVFQGKGLSDAAAKVSGLMEAIECFHAENAPRPLTRESFLNINPGFRMNLSRLPRLKGRTFQENIPIQWIVGRDLINGMEKFVPYQIVHMDCTPQSDDEEHVFIADTTGLASGANITQAINHALAEAIERDAQALWSLTRPAGRAAQKIRLRDVADEFVQDFIASCDIAGVAVAAWNITSDIGVPTIICKVMARQYSGNGVRPAFGSSAHMSPLTALQKAIAEAAQSRITFISGARDDQYAENYETQLSESAFRRWYADVVDQPEMLDFYDIPDLSCRDPAGNQAQMLDMLAAQGLNEVIAVDLGKQEYNIPVVKIIVPGLEGVSFSGERLFGERGQHYHARQQGHT